MTARFDVTTLGEAMLRLSVPMGRRLADTQSLELQIGGAEANVAVALAQLGRGCAWLSRLPDHTLAEPVLRSLRAGASSASSNGSKRPLRGSKRATPLA